jgi:hypothetical protein
VRPGLLVELPCSAPVRPGTTPVLSDEGADVVSVPMAALGAVVAGCWDGAPDVPGRDGRATFEAPSAPGECSRVGRGTLSRPRDVSRRPGVARGAVGTAAPRWPLLRLAPAASMRSGNTGGDDRGWA